MHSRHRSSSLPSPAGRTSRPTEHVPADEGRRARRSWKLRVQWSSVSHLPCVNKIQGFPPIPFWSHEATICETTTVAKPASQMCCAHEIKAGLPPPPLEAELRCCRRHPRALEKHIASPGCHREGYFKGQRTAIRYCGQWRESNLQVASAGGRRTATFSAL